MKLRIKGASIRLRLTRSEVEAIGRGEIVEEITRFPDGALLRYRLETSVGDVPLFVGFSNGLLLIRIGSDAAVRWSSGPAVEISESVSLHNTDKLEVLIEKDFECLHPNAGESTEGAFPNPFAPGR